MPPAQFGQLGIGNNRDQNAPQLVQALASEKIAKVACGWRHTLALTASGKVFAWGRGNNGQLGIGKCLDMYAPPPPPPSTTHTATATNERL